MFRKMLIPLDGSGVAEGVLPYASRLARGLGIPVVIMSVVNPDRVEIPQELKFGIEEDTPEVYVGVMGVGIMDPVPAPTHGAHVRHAHEGGEPHATQIFDRIEYGARSYLERVEARLAGEGLTDVESLVTFGHPAEEIVRVAEEQDCNLIAMSTHGRNMVAREILGSVTDKVVHASSVPVLTLTPEKAKEHLENGADIDSVIVPLDGSRLAEAALPFATELARRMSLKLILARDVEFGVFSTLKGEYKYISTIPLDDEMEAEAVKYLKETAGSLKSTGLNVEWRLLRGGPAATVNELAGTTPGSIVVMATHGRSGVKRWALGSVTEKVVRSSGDPVVIVPPHHHE